MKKNLIIIPARGGSKGIPNKNTRPINGKPLIIHALSIAEQIEGFDIYLNTDSKKISDLAIQTFGTTIKVFHRTSELGEDHSTLDEVIYNQIDSMGLKSGIIVTLQATSPLLSVGTILNAIKDYKISNVDTLITVLEKRKLEWEIEDNQTKPLYNERVNRQYLKPKYSETGGLVITNVESIKSNCSRFGNSIQLFPIPEKESLDIDTSLDWFIAEHLLRRKKLVFITSANNLLGSGHIQRVLSLAEYFPGFEIDFVLINTSLEWIKMVKDRNYNYTTNFKSVSEFAKQEVEARNSHTTYILDILDTQKKDILNLKELNDCSVISFEDLGPGSTVTDLTINELYPSIFKGKNIKSGPKYSFFRTEFLDIDSRQSKSIHDIAISFGGTDPGNLTLEVLMLIEEYSLKKLNVIIIIGLGSTRLIPSIEKIIKDSRHSISIVKRVQNISTIFKNSHLCFTGGGRTVYEILACKSLPLVICQNPKELKHLFANENNGVINFGLFTEEVKDSIKKRLEEILSFGKNTLHIKKIINPNESNKRVVKLIEKHIR